MTIAKNDFIEIEFTGRIKDSNEVFDTNIKKVAEEAGIETKKIKPFILSVGNKMLPENFDADLIGKELQKDYKLELEAKKAFGERNREMIKMIPTKLFLEQRINPERGMQLSLDGQLVKILSNSGGRTLVDFNNPLAGKDVIYEYQILRKVEETKEKIDGLQEFFFRKAFPFEEKDKKIIFKVKKGEDQYVSMFAPKFKELLNLDIETEVEKEKK
jgi:FKBP-type peptidyl-prolyl cis-trans isomerase 2